MNVSIFSYGFMQNALINGSVIGLNLPIIWSNCFVPKNGVFSRFTWSY